MNAPAPGKRAAERKRVLRPRRSKADRSAAESTQSKPVSPGTEPSGSGRSGGRGSRRPALKPPRPGRGGLLGLGLVLVAGGLVAAAGAVTAEPEKTSGVSEVPVSETAGACLGSSWPGTTDAVTLAPPLPGTSKTAEGEGAVRAGDPGADLQPVRKAGRGVVASLSAPSGGEAVAVTASGADAAGRTAFQTQTADTGLAAQECPAPRGRWWFTGGGADLDHRSRLVLANLDPGPAVVDVLVQGPDGPAEDLGTRGVTVAPGEVRTIDLVEIAPQADELAVHVEAARGRVVAGLADSFATQQAAAPGVEWVPGQTDPARALSLGPLPRTADARTLVVANPGDREAIVSVRVSGQAGTFAPSGLEQLTVPPQSVATADLGNAVGEDASSVVLRSQVPITATVRSTSGSDAAYAGAVPVLDGPAAAYLPSGVKAEVQLTAGDKGGTATVTAYSGAGKQVASTELQIDPTATASWSPKGGAAYVVVSPGKGAVSGGVALAGDSGVSQIALQPLPVTLRRPVVIPVVG